MLPPTFVSQATIFIHKNLMRSFKTLRPGVHTRLELPVSKRCEVMSSCCMDGTEKCSIWVDLEGEAEGSGVHPLEKSNDGSESSVYLICSGPRLSPLSECKWSSFVESIRYVHVPDSVEEISDGCFRNCWYLSLVVFREGSSVKRIGVEAFTNCCLRDIHIPKSVEQICDRCFYNCGQLRRITFHECSVLKRIGEEAFTGMADNACRLTEIYIPDSVEELCDSCFFECTSLSRIIFGPQSSLKRLGQRLFFGIYHSYAPRLTEIRIPDRVETIGEECFSSCPLLSQVIFGECSSLKVIGRSAFSGDCEYGCPLGRIRIPDSVTRLRSGCFRGCQLLSCVSFGDASVLRKIGACAFRYCALNEIRIPDTVTRLGDFCFDSCPLERITFGELSSLKRIGLACFCSCHLVEFSIPKSVKVVKGCVFTGCPLSHGVTCVENPHLSILDSLLFSSLHELSIRCPVVGVLSEVVIPGNVKSIGEFCFSGYEHLSSVTFSTPSTLRRLGRYAFQRCPVTELLIPSSVVYIGNGCFAGCEMLVRVTFSEPSELKKLGTGAFNGCKRLEEIHIPDGVEDLSDRCFFDCQVLQRVTFGESSSLRRMGVKVFAGYGMSDFSLIQIHIPDSVEEICDRCFEGCRTLQVTFGESSALKRVHRHAFQRSVLEKTSLPPAAVFFRNPRA